MSLSPDRAGMWLYLLQIPTQSTPVQTQNQNGHHRTAILVKAKASRVQATRFSLSVRGQGRCDAMCLWQPELAYSDSTHVACSSATVIGLMQIVIQCPRFFFMVSMCLPYQSFWLSPGSATADLPDITCQDEHMNFVREWSMCSTCSSHAEHSSRCICSHDLGF